MSKRRFPNTEPLARSAGPETSHAAAEKFTSSGNRDSWKSKIVDWFTQHTIVNSETALTAAEFAEASGFDPWKVSRRLPDCRRDGFLVNDGERLCRVSSAQRMTWRLPDPPAAEVKVAVEHGEPKQESLFGD